MIISLYLLILLTNIWVDYQSQMFQPLTEALKIQLSEKNKNEEHFLSEMKKGNYFMLDYFISRKIKLNYNNINNINILTISAENNNLDLLKKLIENYKIFEIENKEELCDYFVLHKINKVYCNFNEDNVLSKVLNIFIFQKNQEGIDYILSLNKNIKYDYSALNEGDVFFNIINEQYFKRQIKYDLSPLDYAICNGDLNLVKKMIEKGAKVNEVNFCSGIQNNIELFKLLIDKNINPVYSLFGAIVFNNYDIVKYIIDNFKEKLNFKDYRTYLVKDIFAYAIGFKNIEIYDYLIANKIDKYFEDIIPFEESICPYVFFNHYYNPDDNYIEDLSKFQEIKSSQYFDIFKLLYKKYKFNKNTVKEILKKCKNQKVTDFIKDK